MESKSKNTPRTRRKPSHFSLFSFSSDCVATQKPRKISFFSLCCWSKSLKRSPFLTSSFFLSFPFCSSCSPRKSLLLSFHFSSVFPAAAFAKISPFSSLSSFLFLLLLTPKISTSFLSFFCRFTLPFSLSFFFPFSTLHMRLSAA